MTADDKVEILELVRKSPLSVKETLRQLGIPRSTYLPLERAIRAQRDHRITRPQAVAPDRLESSH